jgi:hypothetical protein
MSGLGWAVLAVTRSNAAERLDEVMARDPMQPTVKDAIFESRCRRLYDILNLRSGWF